MTYLEIEAFLAVIEHGTLTQAADHIFISQPALSKRISLLEEELGFRLIERQKGSRSITLIPYTTLFRSHTHRKRKGFCTDRRSL